MAPFGFLRGHQLRRTPLSLAVPLDGTEHEMGLRQLEKYSRRRLSVRKRYRRYKGPFIEYLTVEDLKKGVKDWREFLHTRNARQDSYSVPGSLDALMERLEENIVYYLVIGNATDLFELVVECLEENWEGMGGWVGGEGKWSMLVMEGSLVLSNRAVCQVVRMVFSLFACV